MQPATKINLAPEPKVASLSIKLRLNLVGLDTSTKITVFAGKRQCLHDTYSLALNASTTM